MQLITLFSRLLLANVNIAIAAVVLPSTVNDTTTSVGLRALLPRDDEHGTTLCTDINFGGYCQTFSNTRSGLKSSACIRLDDSIRGKVSSVKPFGPNEKTKGTYCRYFVNDHCLDFSLMDPKAPCGSRETSEFAGFSDLKSIEPSWFHAECDQGGKMDKKIQSFWCWFPYRKP
ncbi:hypothetical protein B0T20DRAFT_151852 [Sordaria brevicollis]|uniref:Uncharacterized protein n=1 Tax=Sordaria brevicollis TaxID=83679 RepID=A0AAE0PJ34_SORBR|nr:hypothetical protein B0T20DRAFT_151852 [Sordaria brevicollis]